MPTLVGRIEEIKILEKLYKSKKSESVAIYGRRRVGKTFLIRSNRFVFQFTGIANTSLENQLMNFNDALKQQHFKLKLPNVSSWLESFNHLKKPSSKNLSS
jgi:uncharacterized protein